MEPKRLLDRVRQLQAADRNAVAVYHDLELQTRGTDLEEIFRLLVEDEARHVKLERELIEILERIPGAG